jgi:hypothetical protein
MAEGGMMRAVPLLFVLMSAAPAVAEVALTPEEFEAEVTGRTLTYATPDGPYGIERYMDGRRVTWGFLNGECYDGVWFPEGDAICFAYKGIDEVQCWRFWREGAGLTAEFVGEGGSLLFEMTEDGLPLVCGGVGA